MRGNAMRIIGIDWLCEHIFNWLTREKVEPQRVNWDAWMP